MKSRFDILSWCCGQTSLPLTAYETLPAQANPHAKYGHSIVQTVPQNLISFTCIRALPQVLAGYPWSTRPFDLSSQLAHVGSNVLLPDPCQYYPQSLYRAMTTAHRMWNLDPIPRVILGHSEVWWTSLNAQTDLNDMTRLSEAISLPDS